VQFQIVHDNLRLLWQYTHTAMVDWNRNIDLEMTDSWILCIARLDQPEGY
jgi:hypothetical protein